jgi:hypothetical protein
MLSTSLAAIVLSGLAAASSAVEPTWQTDYATAVARATESKKPIAVFIAHGGAGYARVVADGGLPADATRVLGQSYVCLYVDTDTANGKELARSFEMTEGLVISGRAGEKQALRHDGKVHPTDLSRYLTRYAGTQQVVVTTETPNAVVVQPTVAAPVYTAPAPTYYQPVRPAASNCST